MRLHADTLRPRADNIARMDVSVHLSRHGPVARRADLLRAGFDDRSIRQSLRAHRIFRVRHGWYARIDAPQAAVRAVRVGGMVSGVEALRLRGLFLPTPDRIDIVVPHNATGLRRPDAMRKRLRASDPVRIHWISPRRNSLPSREWIASEDDALVLVLRTQSREVAVAACDGVLRYLGWSSARLNAAFARAPSRVRGWRSLVDGRADAWGETAVRLRLRDAGIAFTPQREVRGVGRFDGAVAEGVFIEIDGAQHDESWSGEEPSSFERDHLKDLGLARLGARSIRITYAMYAQHWDACVEAIRMAIDLDARARAFQNLRRSRAPALTARLAAPISSGSP